MGGNYEHEKSYAARAPLNYALLGTHDPAHGVVGYIKRRAKPNTGLYRPRTA